MSAVDLHLEELLDKEVLGELSADERTRLDAHLAVCSACRFERVARDDFRAEFAAESQRAKLAGMVSLALGETRRPEESAKVAPLPAPAPRPLVSRRTRTAILLAAAVLVVSAAAGAEWSRVRLFFTGGTLVEPSPAATEATDPAPSAKPMKAKSGRPLAAPTTVASEAPPDESASAEIVDEPAPPPAPAPSATHEARAATPSPAVVLAPEPSPAPPPSAEPPARTAASLFSEANDARSRGDYGAAMSLYSEIESSFPGSAEATTTLAILGRLLLDRGDASGALVRFDQYLARGGGALREEAMVGRGSALERMGRTQEEAAAWTALLAAFPGSAHAAHARARLEAIGKR